MCSRAAANRASDLDRNGIGAGYGVASAAPVFQRTPAAGGTQLTSPGQPLALGP